LAECWRFEIKLGLESGKRLNALSMVVPSFLIGVSSSISFKSDKLAYMFALFVIL